jgi:hypothetical protein
MVTYLFGYCMIYFGERFSLLNVAFNLDWIYFSFISTKSVEQSFLNKLVKFRVCFVPNEIFRTKSELV